MARQVGTTGQTIWMTDDDPDGPVTTVYPEGEPEKVRLLGSVIAMSNGGFRPVAHTAAVGRTIPGDEYLRRRNLWNDPGSGQFKRRGWSSLKGLALRLLDGSTVRDDARTRGTTQARLRDNRFAPLGLRADDVVTVRYDTDEVGRLVLTRDGGRTRSYRVPWEQLAPVDGPSGQDEQSMKVDTTPIVEVESGARPISSPPSLTAVVPERSDPAAARAEALRILEPIPDDPFDVPDGSDQLSPDDRAKLDVILQAGAVLLGDLRAEQTAAQRGDVTEYWSEAELGRRQDVAERSFSTARERFAALRQELVEDVVNETGWSENVPYGAVLPEGPFTIRDSPDDMDIVSVEFEDANGSLWRVKPVLTGNNRIGGWQLQSLADSSTVFPTAWVARRGEQNARAQFRSRAAVVGLAVRQASKLVRSVEFQRQHKAALRMYRSPTEARDALADAVLDAQPELWDAVTRIVRQRMTSRADKTLALIGDFDSRRPIEVRPSVRPNEQTILLPTVTASGQERLLSVSMHRSVSAEHVSVRDMVIFDNRSTEQAPPVTVGVVTGGFTPVRSAALGAAFDDWFTWTEAERAFTDRDRATYLSVAKAWAAEALAAGATPSVESITSRRDDQTRGIWMKAAARVIPSALVEAINDRVAPLTVTTAAPTERQSFYRESEYMVSLASESSALHEYGHALEYRLPALNRMIWAFYQHRTEGEALVDHPQAGATREDWFFSAYAGRDYGSGPLRNPRRIGREVFTVGLEAVLGARDVVDGDRIDDEHAAFVLGALLLASRPGADEVRVRPVGSPLNVGFAKGEEALAPLVFDTPDVSIDAAIMQVMDAPEWRDSVDDPVRQRAGRARGQWIETASSRHSVPLGDGGTLIVSVDAEVNRRNVRRESVMATGEQGEGLEVRGGPPSGTASWIVTDADGKIVLSTDPRDELDMQPDETVDAFRMRAKQAALEAAMRAKQNDLPSEADLESMSLSELEALFYSLRDNRTVDRNFLYLLRRHIKAKRQGTTIDMLEVGSPPRSSVAGATIDGIRNRDVMLDEIPTRQSDSWKQAVTKISEQISNDTMNEFAAGMVALLVADDQRRQQRVDAAPASARLIRGVGQLDLAQTDLSTDSGFSPGEGTIVTTIRPSSTPFGFEKTYKAMIRREDVVPITDDRDGYTTWMAWDDKANLMRVFKVRDELQQDDGTWKVPSSFTDFGGPITGANGDDTTGARRAAAALMRGAWAKSADSVLSYLLREASLEVSGRPNRPLRKLVEAKSGDADKLADFNAGVAQVAFMRSLARDVVQAGYAETQRRLAELGISEVTLYRGVAELAGMRLPEGRGTVTDAPLSSWTADWEVAQYFADLRKYGGSDWGTPLVMARTVPAEQIMGWAGTAFGSENEMEMVLLGSEKADTLVMEDYELGDAEMEQILPRQAAVVADDDSVIVDEDWIRVVGQSRGDAIWSAIFDGGVVAHFTNDSWEVVGPEPARTNVDDMLSGYLEDGWPYQFGGWTDEAFASGIDPDWMRFRLLGSGARFVLGPAGALGSLRVANPNEIAG